MPFKIILMIASFMAGIIFDYIYPSKEQKIRTLLYQITTVYLLFKIGFSGGGGLVAQQWQTVTIQAIIAIIASSLWTMLVLVFLKRWSSFEPITQVSIASHFGSVSVGTFIAALAFLDSMNIPVSSTAVVWLSIMEFPGIIIGVRKLGISTKTFLQIIKKKSMLAILPIAVILGMLFESSVPDSIKTIVIGQLFMPFLLYFLFEMGYKAADSVSHLKKDLYSLVFAGIIIPIIGGIFGSAIGYWAGYSTGDTFIMAILMASASYVLAPLCMLETLKGVYRAEPEIAQQIVATSMALSIGVTLPFNILIGFELYYMLIQLFQDHPAYAAAGLILPFAFGALSIKRSK